MGIFSFLTLTASGPSAQISQITSLIDDHTRKKDQSEFTDFPTLFPGIPGIEVGRRFPNHELTDHAHVIWSGQVCFWPFSIAEAISKRFRSTAITMKLEYVGNSSPEDYFVERHTIEFQGDRQELLYHLDGCHEFDPASVKAIDHWRVSFVFNDFAREEEVMTALVADEILKKLGMEYTSSQPAEMVASVIRERFPDVFVGVDYSRPYHFIDWPKEFLKSTQEEKSDDSLSSNGYRF